MRTAGQPHPGMPEDFDAVARRYWSAWGDALRAAAPGATPVPDASPWQQQIDWWTTMAKGGGQPASDDALDRFNAQARQWFGTMQQVASQFAGRDAGPADIASAWRQAMGAMGGGAAHPFGAAAMGGAGASPFMPEFGAMPGMAGMAGFGAPHGMPGFGAMPGMDTNPFAALMQGMQQAPGTHGFDHWFAQVAPWLKTLQGGATAMPPMPDLAAFFQLPSMPQTPTAMPTFGHNRERDARWQSLARALGDLQQRMQEYAALMQRAMQDAFVVFEGKLAEHEEPGRQLSSGRALFDVWIDSAEQAYARIALTEEFRSVYGALVDAQMRVRSGVQVEVEHACAQLGMPTRTELDGAHRKIVELERQMRRLRDATSPRAAKTATAETRRATRPARPATAADVGPEAVDGQPPAATRAAAAPAKAAASRVSAKKAAAKTSKASKAATKTVAANTTASSKVASKKAAGRTVATKGSATTKAVPKTAAPKKTRSAKRAAARNSPVMAAKAAKAAKAAPAAPPAQASATAKRKATRKAAPAARSASRRTTPVGGERRAAPAPLRPAAKRAPRPASRRGAMSVFVDTPMPVAPASLKGKR